MFCIGTQWQAKNVSTLHLEQLLVKIHYKDGATIFGAVTKRCFCHNSAPYNRCRHLWGVWAYLCWMILFVSYPFICFHYWRCTLASMLEMKFKPRTESNPHQNTNYLACVPEYQHFLGMVQVNLCQKLFFLHQLTHNMTTDCSLNYKFNT